MNTKFDNQEILSFLEEIKEKLIKNDLDDEILQSIGEVYMLNKFKEEINLSEIDFEEKDLIKFLVLGWYIYTIILKKKNTNIK